MSSTERPAVLDMLRIGSIPRQPSWARTYAVAAGLDQWNSEERAWISENPQWIDYERRLRASLVEAGRLPTLNSAPSPSPKSDMPSRL
jgi:hypothetical protein